MSVSCSIIASEGECNKSAATSRAARAGHLLLWRSLIGGPPISVPADGSRKNPSQTLQMAPSRWDELVMRERPMSRSRSFPLNAFSRTMASGTLESEGCRLLREGGSAIPDQHRGEADPHSGWSCVGSGNGFWDNRVQDGDQCSWCARVSARRITGGIGMRRWQHRVGTMKLTTPLINE